MKSGFYTLGDAKTLIGRYADSGGCSAATMVLRLNEACQRLIPKADWVHTTQLVRIRTDRQTFPLPREFSSIRQVSVGDVPVQVWYQAYELMPAGPGEVRSYDSGTGMKPLIDLGLHPTMYDLPASESFGSGSNGVSERALGPGYSVAAFSTAGEDVGREIQVFGTDRYLAEHGTTSGAFTPSESVRINSWAQGIEGTIAGPLIDVLQSTRLYRHLSSWIKPVTTGHISLFAVNSALNYLWFLAKAHPDDTAPAWRRFRLVNQQAQDDSANILALCKRGALQMSRDDDVLPLQNLTALKLMLMAITKENAGDLERAVALEALAVKSLQEQLKDYSNTSGMGVVILDRDREASLAGVGSSTLIL